MGGSCCDVMLSCFDTWCTVGRHRPVRPLAKRSYETGLRIFWTHFVVERHPVHNNKTSRIVKNHRP